MTKIIYKQSNMEQILSKLNKLSSSLANSASGLSSFCGNSLIGGGVSKIKGTTDIIASRASNTSSIVSNGNDTNTTGELNVKSIFNSIETPEDLKKVYSPIDEVKSNSEIRNDDGKSVNEGEKVKENSVDAATNVEKDILRDILTDENGKAYSEDLYKDEKVSVENIVKDEVSSEKESAYDDSVTVAIEDILKNNETTNEVSNSKVDVEKINNFDNIKSNEDTNKAHEGFKTNLQNGGLGSIGGGESNNKIYDSSQTSLQSNQFNAINSSASNSQMFNSFQSSDVNNLNYESNQNDEQKSNEKDDRYDDYELDYLDDWYAEKDDGE